MHEQPLHNGQHQEENAIESEHPDVPLSIEGVQASPEAAEQMFTDMSQYAEDLRDAVMRLESEHARAAGEEANALQAEIEELREQIIGLDDFILAGRYGGDTPPVAESLSDPIAYNNPEWEALKRENPVTAVRRAGQLGVPQETVDAYVRSVVVAEYERTTDRRFTFLYWFLRNAKGIDDETRAVGARIYEAAMRTQSPGSAMEIASDLYGEDSREFKRAHALSERMLRGQEQADERIVLGRNSTFGDLAQEIVRMSDEAIWEEGIFESEVNENFSELAEEIFNLLGSHAGTNVLQFFRERGYNQRYLSSHLPIRFRRERREKADE